jgi:Uma2 family endonuclease
MPSDFTRSIKGAILVIPSSKENSVCVCKWVNICSETPVYTGRDRHSIGNYALYDGGMTTAQKLLTAEEFFALPDPPEGGKMELVDGKVVIMSPVGRKHGKLAIRLGAALSSFAETHDLGEVAAETGFRLSVERLLVRAPDVSFVTSAQLTDASEDGFIDGPPTLAVEVISPDDRDSEIAAKLADYMAAGTQRVWIVRPQNKSVMVCRPNGDAHIYAAGDILSSDDAGFPVPGFQLPLNELFG